MASRADSELTLIYDDQARLIFDPVDTADNPPSISFNISFAWAMLFQSCTIEHRECWILLDELDRFESELSNLLTTTNGETVLRNMSEMPVLMLSRDGNSAVVRYHAADKSGKGDVVFAISTYAQQLSEMENRLRSYPKWW